MSILAQLVALSEMIKSHDVHDVWRVISNACSLLRPIIVTHPHDHMWRSFRIEYKYLKTHPKVGLLYIMLLQMIRLLQM